MKKGKRVGKATSEDAAPMSEVAELLRALVEGQKKTNELLGAVLKMSKNVWASVEELAYIVDRSDWKSDESESEVPDEKEVEEVTEELEQLAEEERESTQETRKRSREESESDKEGEAGPSKRANTNELDS